MLITNKVHFYDDVDDEVAKALEDHSIVPSTRNWSQDRWLDLCASIYDFTPQAYALMRKAVEQRVLAGAHDE